MNAVTEKRSVPVSSIATVATIVVVASVIAWAVFRLTAWYLLEQQAVGITVQLQELDRQLDNRAQLPSLLSTDPRILDALDSDNTEVIQVANQSLQAAQQTSGVAFIFLLNLQGITVAASNWSDPVSFVGEYYGFRPYFTESVAGRTGTFFAVGATTGIPGYFIAKPVGDPKQPKGVIVVKTGLDSLLNSWLELGVSSVVVDEFGVVILSTDERFLYAPTQTLDASAMQIIDTERRYVLNDANRFDTEDTHRWVWRAPGGIVERYRSVTQHLTSESWRLHRLVPLSRIVATATAVMAALLACVVLLYLLWRSFRHQREQVERERHTAEQLERQVQARTAELESAQKDLIAQSNFAMLGRMSAAINHEINQPLASLRLNLAALRTMVESPDVNLTDVTDGVVDCDRTTKRISRVIQTLRSLTRKDTALFASYPLNRILNDVITTVNADRPLLSQCLRVTNTTEGLHIHCNETLLQQALLNLLYNAFDATLELEEPRVDIVVSTTLNAARPFVNIGVIDNGSGVAESVVDDLFVPFVTDTQRQGGLGLGLALARQIAEDHQGSLQYRPGEFKPAPGFVSPVPGLSAYGLSATGSPVSRSPVALSPVSRSPVSRSPVSLSRGSVFELSLPLV